MVCRTTGGAGGKQVTVKSLNELTAAASAAGAAIIFVEGSISGAAKVQVTSDKSIIGKTGSCMYFRRIIYGTSANPPSSYRRWPHHQWPEERHRSQHEDF